ncbi:MAG: hypothetical protein AB2796_15020 [Candidatus Thiodiazotropha sp.]|jgi:hypothetical protein
MNKAAGTEYWQLLECTVAQILQDDLRAVVRIQPLNRDGQWQYAQYAGLSYARDALIAAHYQMESYPAFLLLGTGAAPIGTGSLTPQLATLLHWPGLACHSYGLGATELNAIVKELAEGARQPLPPAVLPTADDVLAAISGVRHWLQNRLNNAQGMLAIFRSIRDGRQSIRQSQLVACPDMTSEQCDMWQRLIALEVPAAALAPGTGGVSTLRLRVDEYVRRWWELEKIRTIIRESRPEGRLDAIVDIIVAYEAVRDAVVAALQAILVLDNELKNNERNGYGSRKSE